ncbi:hypothetical protein [Pseudalkalibacillus caeni]|uniref:Uncharacterized protein n=1 Tax=Exobacillus caeni TaxID=2574798 RepID=A0A5R9F5P1_9BACL|nr:hypothetical protein [Pseudalkalibacillus caeni]TLS35794.1 hypothetical protein FCL54_18435 [Pseudalkalibacillus caeni]
MIKLNDKVFVTSILGKKIKMVGVEDNRCELYIDGTMKGLCPFDYTLMQINLLEEREQEIKQLIKDDQKLELTEIIKNQRIL